MALTQAKSITIGKENLVFDDLPGVVYYAGSEVTVTDKPKPGEKSMTRARATKALDADKASTTSATKQGGN